MHIFLDNTKCRFYTNLNEWFKKMVMVCSRYYIVLGGLGVEKFFPMF